MAEGSKFSGSMLAGLILLPVSAVVAVALTGILTSPPAPDLPEAGGVTAAASPTVAALAPAVGLTEDDIWQACVPDAAVLLGKESEGSISAIEDAALDALRSVCAQEGFAVDGPATPAPITETVVVQSQPVAAAAPSPANTAASFDDDHSDDHDSDDHRSDDDRSDDDDSS